MLKLNRRELLAGVAVVALSTHAEAWRSGYSGLSTFNGHKVQLGMPFQDHGGYMFTNFMKNGGRWTNTNGTVFDVTTLDVNGYAMSLPQGSIQCVIPIPSAAYIPSYTITWDGTGTIFTTGTVISGNYNTSGVIVSLGYTAGTSGQANFGISAVGTPGVDYPHNIKIIATAEVGNSNVFRADFLSKVQNAGILRFMDCEPAANSGTHTFWSLRKPVSYRTYSDYSFPTSAIVPWGGSSPISLIVPAANVTYDGVDTYNVTWSGQNGAAPTDLTTFIWSPQTQQTVYPSYINLNNTGKFPIAFPVGGARYSSSQALGANQWVCSVFNVLSQSWLTDNGNSSNTAVQTFGVQNGVPPELMINLCNQVGAHLWHDVTQYMVEYNGGLTDYITSFAALAQSTLNNGLLFITEGPNECWNNAKQPTAYANFIQLSRNGAGTLNYISQGATTTGSAATFTVGRHNFSVGQAAAWSGVLTSNSAGIITSTTTTTITVATTVTGSGGAGVGIVYGCNAVSTVTTGASTVFSGLSAHNFVLGSRVQVGAVGGAMTNVSPTSITGFVTAVTASSITVNVATTGAGGSSSGYITPISGDFNLWYGNCMAKTGQGLASVFGSSNANIKYKCVVGFQESGGAGSVTGQGTGMRLAAPGYVAAGGVSAYSVATDICTASYWGCAYSPSDNNSTIGELKYAYQSAVGNLTQQAAAQNAYINGVTAPINAVNITNIATGSSTIISVDNIDYFLATPAANSGSSPPPYVDVAGVTGTLGTALNGVTLTVTVMSNSSITVSVNSTSLTGSFSGATISTRGTNASFTFAVEYGATGPYKTFYNTYCGAALNNLGMLAYEGGFAPDPFNNDQVVPVVGITTGSTTTVVVGANAYDYLVNTAGLPVAVGFSGVTGTTELNTQGPTGVTFAGGGSANITWSGNTLVTGQCVLFIPTNGVGSTFPVDSATGTNIVAGALYYVVSTGSTFQVSTTKGGTASTFTIPAGGVNIQAVSCWHVLSAVAGGNSIVIDAVSSVAWAGAGNWVYPGSQFLITAFRDACRGCSACQTQSVQAYTNWYAIGALAKFPSEYQLAAASTYGMFFPDIANPIYTPARYNAMLAYG